MSAAGPYACLSSVHRGLSSEITKLPQERWNLKVIAPSSEGRFGPMSPGRPPDPAANLVVIGKYWSTKESWAIFIRASAMRIWG